MSRLPDFRYVVFVYFTLTATILDPNPAIAEETRHYRGEVGSFTNDFFGDGHDRWRTGSYQRSYYSDGRRFSWADGIELRARAEIVTPWTPSLQTEGDLPYTTSIGAGVLAHNRVFGFDTRVGGEVLLLGDATGLEALQSVAHKGPGMEDSFDPSRDDIVHAENGMDVRFEAEIGRTINLSETVMIRPYVEATGGADISTGLGVDVVLGRLGSADVWTRDVVTGRLLTPQVNQRKGTSWVAGWDIRSVERSLHVPESAGVELETTQQRGRLGVQFGSEFANFFIGQAWLSPSFVGQTETQRLGMMSVSFSF